MDLGFFKRADLDLDLDLKIGLDLDLDLVLRKYLKYVWAEIGMEGTMETMSYADFKCPFGKCPVETMSHYFLGT